MPLAGLNNTPFDRMQLLRGLVWLAAIVAMVTALTLSYFFFRDRLTTRVQNEAQSRVALFAGSIKGDIQRNAIAPRILSRDPVIIASFLHDRPTTNNELEGIAIDLDGSPLVTVDLEGVVRNASQSSLIGTQFLDPALVKMGINDRTIAVLEPTTRRFIFAQRVVDYSNPPEPLGLVAVTLDLAAYQRLWSRLGLQMMLLTANDDVLVSYDPMETRTRLPVILGRPDNANWQSNAGDFYTLNDEEQVLVTSQIGFRSWELAYFVPASEIRDQLNIILIGEVLVFAVFISGALYIISRRTARVNVRLKRESVSLRRLNTRLLAEIEQRRRAEASLEVAEQSLEQSSKLAVIGQMSAAVGHELNQPLAAMRTYLAGAKMLLRRNRFVEAINSINRIDDLIDRMGSITRQLRAFARVHDSGTVSFDLRDATDTAMSMMAPQFGQSRIALIRDLPDEPVMVVGDRLRTEQILINLLRNANDAVKGDEKARIEITVDKGPERAWIRVLDNGVGIKEPEKLFEPFYTTKVAGEGLGLGLAISAGYAKEMDGNLIARNAAHGGAEFELNLPRSQEARSQPSEGPKSHG